MSEEQTIIVDTPEAGICRITLNRPEKMNAFNAVMIDALNAELERIRFDPSVRVVILTGNGRGFCSGADITGMGVPEKLPDPETVSKANYGRYFLTELAKIPPMLRELPQPVICAVNGSAAGAGYAFALAADCTLMADSAKFVNAIHTAASGAELGMSYMLPRAVGTQRAAEILYSMRPVLAEEAERIGLVLRAVPADDLQDEAIKLARSFATNVPIGLWVTKEALWHNQNAGSLRQAMDFEHRGVFIAQSTEDAKEKRKAFLEKRPPKFTQM